ncbi:MAG: amidohydrolase [Clostridia bacterium]
MEKVDMLVINAMVITMDDTRRILTNGGLAIKADLIVEVASTENLLKKYSADKVIDATDKFVFPGMVNTHNHLFQVLLKGVGKDKKLIDWLECTIMRSYNNISEDDIYLATMVGCIEQIKSGVTTVLDYQYAHGKRYLSDAVIKAFEDLGIRAILGRGHTDTLSFPEYCKCDYNESEKEYFEDIRRLSEKYRDSPTVDIAIAPAIIWTLSEDGFKECARLAKELGTFNTIHTLETEEDNAYSLEKYGISTMEFYERCGILSASLLAVHCAQINKEEIQKLKQYGVKVSYNAISNMMIGYKALPVQDLLDAGIVVGIATDGAASNDNQNMLEVMKISALWQKAAYRDPAVLPATKILEMATIDGADAVFKKDVIGSLEVGKKADFFIYNPKFCNTVPVLDPVVSIVYGAGENNIETTVVNGKIILEDGKILGIDEEEMLMRLQKAAYDLRKKSGIDNYLWNQKVDVEPFQK